MSKFLNWLSFYYYRIVYYTFLLILIIEIIVKSFYQNSNNLKQIFDYLFIFFIGLLIGSYLALQCVKVLHKNNK